MSDNKFTEDAAHKVAESGHLATDEYVFCQTEEQCLCDANNMQDMDNLSFNSMLPRSASSG